LHAESYVAGYVGGARTSSSDLTLKLVNSQTRLTFDKVPFTGKSFESPIYYGYRVGYYFTKHIGLEGEFIHLKVHADLDRVLTVHGTIDGLPVLRQAPIRAYADQFEVSHGLNMLLVNAVLRQGLLGGREPRDARIALIVRVGAGPTLPRPEVIVFGAAGGAYEMGPVAVQGAAGIETKLWRGLHLLTEYKYTLTPTSFAIPNGTASFDVHSHHFATGLAIHF
jgi:lipid A oxidase